MGDLVIFKDWHIFTFMCQSRREMQQDVSQCYTIVSYLPVSTPIVSGNIDTVV